VGRISLDHCAQVGVPETDNSVLTTREDIFRASFGVPCDMHGAFVIPESVAECARERLRTSGRCHHCKVPLSIVVAGLPRGWLPGTVRAETGDQSHRPSCHSIVANGQEIALSSSPASRKAFTPTNTLDFDFYSSREVQLLRKLI
jgi:hypothetical protein